MNDFLKQIVYWKCEFPELDKELDAIKEHLIQSVQVEIDLASLQLRELINNYENRNKV